MPFRYLGCPNGGAANPAISPPLSMAGKKRRRTISFAGVLSVSANNIIGDPSMRDRAAFALPIIIYDKSSCPLTRLVANTWLLTPWGALVLVEQFV